MWGALSWSLSKGEFVGLVSIYLLLFLRGRSPLVDEFQDGIAGGSWEDLNCTAVPGPLYVVEGASIPLVFLCTIHI